MGRTNLSLDINWNAYRKWEVSSYKFLLGLLRKCRRKVGLDETQPPWLLDEATFEKMGAMISDNHCKLVGLYDELSSFLTQINLYKGRGLSDSHDLSLFLQLYNGHPWARKTGMHTLRVVTTVLDLKCKDSISLHFKTIAFPICLHPYINGHYICNATFMCLSKLTSWMILGYNFQLISHFQHFSKRLLVSAI